MPPKIGIKGTVKILFTKFDPNAANIKRNTETIWILYM